MPRKSAASLLTSPIDAGASWLEPPATLSPDEAAIFTTIVTAHQPSHFRASDMPLLLRYVEAAALGDEAALKLRKGAVIEGKPSPWLAVAEKCTRALVMLSLRLRISPQARTPNNSGRTRPVSHYDTMRLDHADDA